MWNSEFEGSSIMCLEESLLAAKALVPRPDRQKLVGDYAEWNKIPTNEILGKIPACQSSAHFLCLCVFES